MCSSLSFHNHLHSRQVKRAYSRVRSGLLDLVRNKSLIAVQIASTARMMSKGIAELYQDAINCKAPPQLTADIYTNMIMPNVKAAPSFEDISPALVAALDVFVSFVLADKGNLSLNAESQSHVAFKAMYRETLIARGLDRYVIEHGYVRNPTTQRQKRSAAAKEAAQIVANDAELAAAMASAPPPDSPVLKAIAVAKESSEAKKRRVVPVDDAPVTDYERLPRM